MYDKTYDFAIYDLRLSMVNAHSDFVNRIEISDILSKTFMIF